MGAGICINHRNRDASERCHTCHKPLCAECVRKAGGNIFCSLACEENYAKFHRHYKSDRPSLLASLVKWALVLAVVGAAVLFIGGKVLKIGVLVEILKKFGF